MRNSKESRRVIPHLVSGLIICLVSNAYQGRKTQVLAFQIGNSISSRARNHLKHYDDHSTNFNSLLTCNQVNSRLRVKLESKTDSESEDAEILIKQDSRADFLREVITSPIVEVQLALLVVLNCALTALGTVHGLPDIVEHIIFAAENVIGGVFAIEYFARWYLSGFSPRHLVKPIVLIDMIAILPLIIQVLPALGFMLPPNITGDGLVSLRLLRVLRLQRVLEDYETFARFEIALGFKPRNTSTFQLQLARVVMSVVTLLSVASGLIYSAEHNVNPNIPDYFAALYFGLTTLTTVGFGDIYPMTTEGRLIVAGSIFFGITVIPYQSAALAEALLDFSKERQKQREEMQRTGNFTKPAMFSFFDEDDRLKRGVSGTSLFGEECNACDSAEPAVYLEDGRFKLRQKRDSSAGSGASVVSNSLVNLETGPDFPSMQKQNIQQALPERESAHSSVSSCVTENDTSKSIADNQPILIMDQKIQSSINRVCQICGSSPHRGDAGFCWGCGSPLPPINFYSESGQGDDVGHIFDLQAPPFRIVGGMNKD